MRRSSLRIHLLSGSYRILLTRIQTPVAAKGSGSFQKMDSNGLLLKLDNENASFGCAGVLCTVRFGITPYGLTCFTITLFRFSVG